MLLVVPSRPTRVKIATGNCSEPSGGAYLAVLVEPLLIVRRVLREQIVILHRRLLAIVREDEVCRRLMTTPVSAPWWR